MEQYIKAYPGEVLASHTQQHVDDYLRLLPERSGLRDWQCRQVILAIQILFVEMVRAGWAQEYPWREKITTMTTLEDIHDTVALDELEAGIEKRMEKIAAATNFESRIWSKHPQHYRNLITQIRIRHYSIKTEKSYSAWIARFITFNKQQDPADLHEDSIARFFEHLVLERHVSGSTQSPALNAIVFFTATYCIVIRCRSANSVSPGNSGGCRSC